MIPLFARLLLRSAQTSHVLPVATMLGAIFLIWADLLARTVVAPAELPVGLLTALFGGPVFLWLLIRRGGGAVSLGDEGRG
jgi:iron complex transport system permease protein